MQDDVWRWKLEESGDFSVKSSYSKLEALVSNVAMWTEEEKGVFDRMWKSPAPSKVVAFAWKVLLNRVPTKVNLATRNALGPEDSTRCVLCNAMEESSRHLFLHCEVASRVWCKLMVWIGRSFITPPNLFVHWECWNGGERNKNVLKGLWLIWHTTIWVMWKAQNDKIFKGVNFAVDDIVEEVKVLSWRWTLSRLHIPACLYFEWCWDPHWCLLRKCVRV
jgi:hypothetical protein